MEKVQGKELSHYWDTLPGKQKYIIVQQIVEWERKFASTGFDAYGSLYYRDDLLPDELGNPESHLYTNIEGMQRSSRFAVGPITSRKYFDDGRSDVDVNRGPCMFVLIRKATRIK